MLNLPSSESESSANHLRSEYLRRPLSGSERRRGWPDVREQDGSTTRAPKYHVDLNTTAHLDWAEWQRLCAADARNESDAAPTWCMLPAIYTGDDDDDGKAESEQADNARPTDAHTRSNPAQQRFVRRLQASPERIASPPTAPSA